MTREASQSQSIHIPYEMDHYAKPFQQLRGIFLSQNITDKEQLASHYPTPKLLSS